MNSAQTADSGADSESYAPQHSDYFLAIMPETVTVLGLTLKPLSLGRYRLLSRYKVAYVSDHIAEATFRDLILGVLICSKSVAEFNQLINSPKASKQIEKWAKKALYPICNGYLAMSEFKQFIENNSKSPRYFEEANSGGKTSGAHWSQTCEVVLRGQLGWSKEEVDEEPLNKAIYDFYKHMEQQGCVSLMSPEEIIEADRPPTAEEDAAIASFLEQIKAAKAEREKQQNG